MERQKEQPNEESGGYSGIAISQGVSQRSWSETGAHRQAQGWERLMGGKTQLRATSVQAVGHWVQAPGGLARERIWLTLAGPKLDAGQKVGKLPFPSRVLQELLSGFLDCSPDTTV